MKKNLIISVKEKYSNLILDGSKVIELRKSRPNVKGGDNIIIYCTSPTKAIVGVGKVKEIIEHSPDRMWRLHSKKLGIRRSEYSVYFEGSNKAIGIVLTDIKKLRRAINLRNIKKQIPTFTPPQTYKYFLRFVLHQNESRMELSLPKAA